MKDNLNTPVVESESGPLDQTFFGEESAILPTESSSSKVVVAPIQPSRKKLIAFIATPAVLILFAIVLLLSSRPMGELDQRRVVATPTPNQAIQTELDRRFELLQQDIDAADPTKAHLSFPPIDLTLELQDATAVQQRRRP